MSTKNRVVTWSFCLVRGVSQYLDLRKWVGKHLCRFPLPLPLYTIFLFLQDLQAQNQFLHFPQVKGQIRKFISNRFGAKKGNQLQLLQSRLFGAWYIDINFLLSCLYELHLYLCGQYFFTFFSHKMLKQYCFLQSLSVKESKSYLEMAETLSQTDLTFQRVSYFDGSIMLPKDDQENFLAQFLTGIFSLVLLD